MRIAIFSDWHLGLDFDSETKEDSFFNLLQAFTQIKKENVDLIITCGDLFDKQIPSHEVFFKSIELLNRVDIENKLNLTNTQNKLLKLPMLAIIGNHEYRGKDFISSVELLEVMGFLRVLHANHIFFSKDSQTVNIFGLTGVPDRFAKDILVKWNPQPLEGYNILLLHQSFKEYIPFDEQEMLSLSDLPKGFDLIVNGHLHWQMVHKLDEKTKFIMPGSTIPTQNKKIESEKEKGFFILDTLSGDLNFKEIKNIRKIFYLDLSLKSTNPEKISQEIQNEIQKIKDIPSKKPFLRVKLKGELEEGFFLKDLELKEIEKKYSDLFYISFSNLILEKKLKESVEKLKSLEQNKGNLFDISKNIFFDQIKQTKISKDFDFQRLFDLLYNGELDRAKEHLLND